MPPIGTRSRATQDDKGTPGTKSVEDKTAHHSGGVTPAAGGCAED